MAVQLPQQAKRHWTQQGRLEHLTEQRLAHPMLKHVLQRLPTAACLTPDSLHPGVVDERSPIGPHLLTQAMEPVWIHGADAVVNIAADDPQPIANQACRMRFDRSERYSSAGWEAAE